MSLLDFPLNKDDLLDTMGRYIIFGLASRGVEE
jgi:hypothetical protein